jgi:hypothetical protein
LDGLTRERDIVGMSIFGLDLGMELDYLGGLGNMGALGLEAVLVSDVGDGVDDAIGAGVGELAADSDGLVLGTSVLQLTLLLDGDAVGCLHTVEQNTNVNPSPLRCFK